MIRTTRGQGQHPTAFASDSAIIASAGPSIRSESEPGQTVRGQLLHLYLSCDIQATIPWFV